MLGMPLFNKIGEVVTFVAKSGDTIECKVCPKTIYIMGPRNCSIDIQEVENRLTEMLGLTSVASVWEPGGDMALIRYTC